MKHTYTLLLAATIGLFIPRTASAQNNSIPCTADYNKRLPGSNDPQQELRIQQELKKIREQMQMNQSRNAADTLKIIPIVVHVLHDNGKGALSKAQIIAGINAMNIDLRKNNADTTSIRSFYKPLLSDLKVEMRFAKIDPNGNCTDGINYINTSMTYNVSDTCKIVADWPPDKYFNFWIVNSIDPSPWGLSGTIAGYEKFPWFGINSKYGAVVRSDAWNTGRTLTHEVGHCLGLWHMWQDQSKNNWGDGCSFIVGHDCTDNDDMVCDTPPMYQPNSGCDFNANSCSNDSIGPSPYPNDTLDMVENFMSYSTCKFMFTSGQKDRVIAVFGTYPELQNLVSYTNIVATGTNNGYVAQLCKPEASFTANRTMVCKGGSVTFTDATWSGAPSSWQWDFAGGTPATSASQNPTILYSSAGTYDVRLISTNATGSDTVLLKKFITVSDNTAQYSGASYSEGFEDSTVFYNDWITPATSGKGIWKRTKSASYSGNSSIMINNADPWYGELVEFISPSYNLSSVTTPEFVFKLAYAAKSSTTTEYLKIYVSTDCGASWTLRYNKGSSLLKTVPDQTTPFVPASQSEWKDDKVSISTYSTQTKVRFKFQFVGGRGNNIYIDDLNIRTATGISENDLPDGNVNLYPNPASKETSLEFTLKENISNASIAVYNVLGKVVTEIVNGTKLSAGTHNYKIALGNDIAPGIYFIKMTSGSLQWTKKLIVE